MSIQSVKATENRVKYFYKNEEYNLYYFSYVTIPTDNFQLYTKGPNAHHIQGIKFLSCSLVGIPRPHILLNLAPNMTILSLIDCKLTAICREDLQGLEALKELFLRHNALERLPKGLFDYTPNLEVISIRNNKIKDIDAGILDHLTSLKYCDFSNNITINAKYDTLENQGNVTLEQLKEIIKKCDPVEPIRNEFKQELDNVKKELDNVKKELNNIKKENAELKKEVAALKGNFGGDREINKKHFIVKVRGKEFEVNKNILIANSAVLAKLINQNPDAETLELHDVSEKTFEAILKFMIERTLPNDETNLNELFAASGRLEMKELKDITAEMIMKKITPDDALEILNLAEKFKHEGLRKKAFEELKKRF